VKYEIMSIIELPGPLYQWISVLFVGSADLSFAEPCDRTR